MKPTIFFICFFLLTMAVSSILQAGSFDKILIELPGGKIDEADLIAVKRIQEYANAFTHISNDNNEETERSQFGLIVIIGTGDDSPEIEKEWGKYATAKNDAYIVRTISRNPLVVMASGINKRGMLYAAYYLADLLKTGEDISNLDLFFQPKVPERYVLCSPMTFGGRYFNPVLELKTLNETPRYGYNGILVSPGSGTPVGSKSSPVFEKKDGGWYCDNKNTNLWKQYFNKIKTYQHDIMLIISPFIPSGYDPKIINDFYAGGPEPEGYLNDLKEHFKEFLDTLISVYPEIDRYLFCSTEGGEYAKSKRFFSSPDPGRYSLESYNNNNTKIMQCYFDVFKNVLKEDFYKLSFWTHTFGITNQGIRKMREVLFQYPELVIIEDDYWNNNLWAQDIPSFNYLPEDLRCDIYTHKFGVIQIVTDGEYYGGGSIPNAYPKPLIKSANEAVAKNAEMVLHRLNLHDRTAYGTLFGTLEIIPLAASKQLWKPTPNEPEIWQEWANRRFGKQAAPFVIRALQESENIILKGLTCNGIDLLAVGSEFSPLHWTNEAELSRFYLFSKPNSPMVQKNEDSVIFSEEYTAYQMNTHTIPIEEYRNNQNSARKSVQNGLKEIDKARPYLKDQDYQMLYEIFVNGRNVIEALQLLGEAAYATNIILSNYDNVKDPSTLYHIAIRNLEDFIRKGKLIPEINDNLTKILDNYKQVGNAER